jgi:hypothetical protein
MIELQFHLGKASNALTAIPLKNKVSDFPRYRPADRSAMGSGPLYVYRDGPVGLTFETFVTRVDQRSHFSVTQILILFIETVLVPPVVRTIELSD